MASRLDAKISTFGFADGADVRLEGYIYEESDESGMEAAINIDGVSRTLRVPGALGNRSYMRLLRAIACALSLDMSPEEALSSRSTYRQQGAGVSSKERMDLGYR